jgi:hypothetical protein
MFSAASPERTPGGTQTLISQPAREKSIAEKIALRLPPGKLPPGKLVFSGKCRYIAACCVTLCDLP